MGAYERRQLRAAIGFLFYPIVFTTLLVIAIKVSFTPSPKKPKFDTPSTKSQIEQAQPISKSLVIASTTQDDTAWLDQIPSSLNWTLYHYRIDDPLSSELSVPSPKGNEAMVYLTYIIDHYDDLPDVILFHHAHRQAWHQKLDALDELRMLRPQWIVKAGYGSTRCLTNCENIVPLKGGKPGDWANFARLDRKTHLVSLLDAFMEPWKEWELDEIPPKIAAPCCAQFAVSRERVRRRAKDWWVDMRGWLVATPLASLNSGRLMEHLWHIWFGMPAML